jgi:hypothetical protein
MIKGAFSLSRCESDTYHSIFDIVQVYFILYSSLIYAIKYGYSQRFKMKKGKDSEKFMQNQYFQTKIASATTKSIAWKKISMSKIPQLQSLSKVR